MFEYERSYRTGRAIASILEVVGWIVVGIGLIAALAGLVSGGIFGAASRNFGGNDATAILQIVSALPGIATASLGLFFILQCQHTRATIDNAEMTRDMLALMNGKSLPSESRLSSAVTPEVSKPINYRGFDIIFSDGRYLAYGENFASLDEAQKYLDSIEAPKLRT